MADESLENSIKEHRYEESSKKERSHQEHAVNETRANAAKEVKSITNIYYDCLERIFDFLDLKSLLMVAQTCKRLQIAAAAKFGDEFGKKGIRLYPDEPEPIITMYQEEIEVLGLKLCLSFLRCFGAKISDLSIDYFFEADSMQGYLDQYINQYCADTLTSMEFCNKTQFSNEAFTKPFRNVEKVEIFGGDLKNHLSNFINWFPNLRCLEMICCSFDETATMNVSFPHLEHLDLHIFEELFNFRIEQAATLLQANPQLQSVKLRLRSGLTLSSMLNAIGANSLITKLKVKNTCGYTADVNMDELNRLAAEHPLVEDLILSCYCLTAADAVNFIRQMKSLKRIKFEVKDRPECDRIKQELNNEWKSKVSAVWDHFYIELNR